MNPIFDFNLYPPVGVRMNIARMRLLAKIILVEHENVEFNMEALLHNKDSIPIRTKCSDLQDAECGTVACIAGYACLLFGKFNQIVSMPVAANLLGLDAYNAAKLFLNTKEYVAPTQVRYKDITRKQASAAILRMVADYKAKD